MAAGKILSQFASQDRRAEARRIRLEFPAQLLGDEPKVIKIARLTASLECFSDVFLTST
jgi:hypothetical protein